MANTTQVVRDQKKGWESQALPYLSDPDKEKFETESAAGTASPEIMTSIGPTLDRLWSYSCSLTKVFGQ